MGFAIAAWIVCAGLVFISIRATRGLPSAGEMEAVAVAVERPSRVTEASNATRRRVLILVADLERASSRAVAVAVLNEFISEAELESERGAAVPATLARACFSVGVMLGVLAVADVLGAAAAVSLTAMIPALVAGTAGVTGGMLCYQIDRWASQRRQAYRDAVRRLSRALQRRFPLLNFESAEV